MFRLVALVLCLLILAGSALAEHWTLTPRPVTVCTSWQETVNGRVLFCEICCAQGVCQPERCY